MVWLIVNACRYVHEKIHRKKKGEEEKEDVVPISQRKCVLAKGATKNGKVAQEESYDQPPTKGDPPPLYSETEGAVSRRSANSWG